jgi:uncharacterized protein YceH (UPF0502 family)
MTGTASHRFVDILRRALSALKSFEDTLDVSMDEVLLARIKALEKLVATLEARIDGLTADRP